MEVVDSYGLKHWMAVDDAVNEFPSDCENLLPCDPRCGLQEPDARMLREWLMQSA